MKLIYNFLNRWHTEVHSNTDFMKLLEACREIDNLKKMNNSLGVEVKKLRLQLEIKNMNDIVY